jgi:hypothetical protein
MKLRTVRLEPKSSTKRSITACLPARGTEGLAINWRSSGDSSNKAGEGGDFRLHLRSGVALDGYIGQGRGVSLRNGFQFPGLSGEVVRAGWPSSARNDWNNAGPRRAPPRTKPREDLFRLPSTAICAANSRNCWRATRSAASISNCAECSMRSISR